MNRQSNPRIHPLVIASPCVSKAKQSKSHEFKSQLNTILQWRICGLFSNNNLSIRFWVIDFICLLDSLDLDCHENPADFLAMTKWERFAFDLWIALANLRFAEAMTAFYSLQHPKFIGVV